MEPDPGGGGGGLAVETPIIPVVSLIFLVSLVAGVRREGYEYISCKYYLRHLDTRLKELVNRRGQKKKTRNGRIFLQGIPYFFGFDSIVEIRIRDAV